MLKNWDVSITTDIICVTYCVEAEDGYDAKLKAMTLFFDEFGTPAKLSDIESCIEI